MPISTTVLLMQAYRSDINHRSPLMRSETGSCRFQSFWVSFLCLWYIRRFWDHTAFFESAVWIFFWRRSSWDSPADVWWKHSFSFWWGPWDRNVRNWHQICVCRLWSCDSLAIAFAYVMIKIVIQLTKDQDEKYKIKREQERQRRELRDALRQNARMK